MWIEEKLQASQRRWHKMSSWWKTVLREFLRSGKKRLAVRVGRRGGKSSTLCRLAVCLVVFGDYDIPAGDVGEFIFMSVKKGDAQKRLATIRLILDELGVEYESTAERITLKSMARAFCVYGANAKFAVGMTSIGIMGDEVARWENADGSANPAFDVYASVRPAMITQPNALELMCSSPWSELDYHYETIERGTTDDQVVAVAPTWVANPSPNTTQEKCRKLEPDEQSFWREYGAIPMKSGDSTFFDPVAIDRSLVSDLALPQYPNVGYAVVAGGDFAFEKDYSALSIFHLREGIYWEADGMLMKPERNEPLKPSMVCKAFSEVLLRHGGAGLMADDYYRQTIIEYLAESGLVVYRRHQDPSIAFVNARVKFSQERVRLAKDDRRTRRLKEIQSRPTANGRLRIIIPRLKGSGHYDDISSLVLSLCQDSGTVIETDRRQVVSSSVYDLEEQEYAESLQRESEPIYSESEYITFD